ncbi:MAG: urea ABC transporter permease subunit UrtB [Puia sp.]|nr:urea ABC transporter permease subunit UrtB [Puia sp.]
MKTSFQILLCLALCFIGRYRAAAADSAGVYVEQVLYPQQAGARSLAIGRLAVLQEPSVLPFLEAISSSNLYLLDGKAVTLGSRKSESEDVFTIYELYPSHRLLLDGHGQPVLLAASGLKPVEISRIDRLQLGAAAGWLNIFNADAQKRILAYTQLESASDTTLIGVLSIALKSETNADAYRAGRETWLALRLNHPADPPEARALIDSLSANDGDNTTAILRAYAKNGGLQRDVGLYARQKADEMDSQYAWLQRLQNLFSGLSLGSILILISLGLAIVYGLAGIINMAHGEFLMIGAYATYSVQLFFNNVLHVRDSDWFYLTALPLSFIVAGLAGLLLERLVIRRLYAKPLESLLATWGVSLILIQTARSLFGDLTAVKLPGLLAGGWQVTTHLVLPYSRIFIIVLTAGVVLSIYWLLFRTRLGMQIRAVTQNRNMSACLGINTRRVDAITFFIGSGLAGLAGCAMTLIGNVVPDMGQTYIVDSFLVVVTGGVGKLLGTIAAGLGIGVFSKVLEAFFEAVYGKVLILLFIMIFLQFKPRGLFPDKGRIAED